MWRCAGSRDCWRVARKPKLRWTRCALPCRSPFRLITEVVCGARARASNTVLDSEGRTHLCGCDRALLFWPVTSCGLTPI